MFLGRAKARDTKWMLCFHAAQTGKHLLRTKCFWTKSETFFVSSAQNLCPQQILRTREQTGKHLCRQQCVRNNVSWFARAFIKFLHRSRENTTVKLPTTSTDALLAVFKAARERRYNFMSGRVLSHSLARSRTRTLRSKAALLRASSMSGQYLMTKWRITRYSDLKWMQNNMFQLKTQRFHTSKTRNTHSKCRQHH